MKVDIFEMLLFFDELLPCSDEEQYWFKTTRPDGIFLLFTITVNTESVGVIVHTNPKISVASLALKHCSEIRVLDHKRKCLEVLQKNNKGRCFLSLLEGSLFRYSEEFTVPNAN